MNPFAVLTFDPMTLPEPMLMPCSWTVRIVNWIKSSSLESSLLPISCYGNTKGDYESHSERHAFSYSFYLMLLVAYEFGHISMFYKSFVLIFLLSCPLFNVFSCVFCVCLSVCVCMRVSVCISVPVCVHVCMCACVTYILQFLLNLWFCYGYPGLRRSSWTCSAPPAYVSQAMTLQSWAIMPSLFPLFLRLRALHPSCVRINAHSYL